VRSLPAFEQDDPRAGEAGFGGTRGFRALREDAGGIARPRRARRYSGHAVATFLGTESQKDAIQGQTKSAVAEGNTAIFDTEQLVVASDQFLLASLAQAGDSQLATAAKDNLNTLSKAASDKKIADEQKKRDNEVTKSNKEVSHANDQHKLYEISEVLLQIAIVLASVAIIARRRFLLGGSGALATAGVVMLAVGLTV
jgi:hypothetical protein